MLFHPSIKQTVRVTAERVKQHVVRVRIAHMIHQPFKNENKLVGVARADFRFVKQIKLLGGLAQSKRDFQQLATENFGGALTLFREHVLTVDFTGGVVTDRSVA